mgnify:CR=1 FL=1
MEQTDTTKIGEIIEIIGATSLLEIFDDLEEAVEGAAGEVVAVERDQAEVEPDLDDALIAGEMVASGDDPQLRLVNGHCLPSSR